MLKRWLLYIAGILLALFLSIMYYEPFPVLCLLLLIIVPLVGALIQLPLLWFVDVKFSAFDVVCERGEGSQVKFAVQNRSVLPIFKLRIHMKTENEFSEHVQNHYVEMRLPANTDVIVPLHIYSEDCGRIRLMIEKVQIMGLIPIYSWTFSKKKFKKVVYMTVLPRIQNLSMTVSQDTKNYPVDWEMLKIKKEATQIYKVRPFQPGDRLQRIHWKLSAKNEEWMIREITTPPGASVLLVMDWTEKSFANLNRIMEVMVSLAFGLAMESCKSLITSSTNSGEWYVMSSEEDLYLIFGEIMHQKMNLDVNKKGKKKTEQEIKKSEEISLIHLLEQKCVGITFSHMYYVTDHSEDDLVALLETSHLARKKTFIYAGEQDAKHLEKLLEQYKIEYFCMDKNKEDAMSTWNFIV